AQVAFDETMPAVAEPVHAPVSESFAPVATLAAGAALGAIQNAGDSLQTSALPLVTYGILLRRHLDLSTLIQAQHAVSEEVGHEDDQILT
ncbi:hypothetical protein M3M33_14550, partial [Loigolactobacillus coryniformis]|uniref:hypothetical protein n=1 Tax=Loigolactobacillus coryniformis TaxID=1610 RepID=UPI00201B2D4F